MLQLKMMEKLRVTTIPQIEFISSFDQVIQFQDLFSFIQIMGYGGFGIVVAAKEKATGRKVALKIVDKSMSSHHVKALEHEAKILE